MNVRNKTRQRLRLLLVGILVVVLLGAGGYVFRKRQIANRVLRSRDEGYAALEAGDYYNAMHKIGVFVQRNPDHVEALSKYAQARVEVIDPNGKHIVEGVSLYRRILELSPDDADANKRLLDLYLLGGFNSEILSRTATRSDAVSLNARARALGKMGRHADARKTALKYVELQPNDLEMQGFVLNEIIAEPESSDVPARRQVLNRATMLQQAHPDNPRFELLLAFAHFLTDDPVEALKWVRQAAARSVDDPKLIEPIVAQFDGLRHYDEALAVLERAASIGGDIDFRRRLVSRLYQSGKHAQVIQRVTELAPDATRGDTDLLAMKAMALIATGQRDAAKPILSALSNRAGDVSAHAWSQVLAAVPLHSELSDDRRVIDACREALRAQPRNPYFQCYLADALVRVGEGDAAMQIWLDCRQYAPAWPAPRSRILRAWMAQGYNSEALLVSADEVNEVAASDPDALATVAIARARVIPATDVERSRQIVELIDRIQQLRPGEELSLSLKVSMLARTDKAAAAEFVRRSLGSEPPLPESAYVALAGASEAAKLDTAPQCLARCRSLYGNSWKLALANASNLLRAGRADEAVKVFESARLEAPDKDQLSWRVSWAKILDAASDPRASKEWASLSQAFPNDLSVQFAVLSARGSQSDRDLLRHAISTLGSVVGEQGLTWRLADARWIMQGAAVQASAREREEDVVKATAILSQLTRAYANNVQAHVMLSECLFRLNKKPAAAEHLTAAAKLVPQSYEIAIQAASVLQSLGDFDRAKPLLDQAEKALQAATQFQEQQQPVLPASNVGDANDRNDARTISIATSWRRLASLMAARGDTTRAIAVLSKLDSESQPEVDVALASMRSDRGELTPETCRELLAKPTPTNIGIVADFYASAGRAAEAETTLAMLGHVKAAPGERELIRGVFLMRHGKEQEALVELRKSCSEAPVNRNAWSALITALCREGKADDVAAAALDAHKSLPDDKAFSAIVENAELIRGLGANRLARGLLIALPTSPEDAAAIITAMRVMRDAEASKAMVADVTRQLRTVADSSPTVFEIQKLVVDLHVVCGSIDDATTVATRTMQLIPADPRAAQCAAEVFASAGRWDQAINAALEWRRRLGNRTWPADQLMATALVAKNRAAEAIERLGQYKTKAQQEPAQWVAFYSVYARALVQVGRIDEARQILDAARPAAPALRVVYLSIVEQAIKDNDVAIAWLEHLPPTKADPSVEEQLQLCRAWMVVSLRGSDPALAGRARKVLSETATRFEKSKSTSAPAWIALASMQEQLDDDRAAEAGYRRALQIVPDDAIAQNNLAMTIVRLKGNQQEAHDLAVRAAAHVNHGNRADFLDTVAHIKLGSGDFPAAEKAMLEALQLRPADTSLRTSLVEVLFAAGKSKQAVAELTDLEKALAAIAKPDPKVVARVEKLRTSKQPVSQAK